MEQSPNRDTKGKKTNKGRKEGSGQIENGHTRRGKKKKSILLCLSCFYFYGERRLPSHAVGKKIIRSIPYMLLFFFKMDIEDFDQDREEHEKGEK